MVKGEGGGEQMPHPPLPPQNPACTCVHISCTWHLSSQWWKRSTVHSSSAEEYTTHPQQPEGEERERERERETERRPQIMLGIQVQVGLYKTTYDIQTKSKLITTHHSLSQKAIVHIFVCPGLRPHLIDIWCVQCPTYLQNKQKTDINWCSRSGISSSQYEMQGSGPTSYMYIQCRYTYMYRVRWRIEKAGCHPVAKAQVVECWQLKSQALSLIPAGCRFITVL